MATTEEKDVRELAAYGIAEAAHYLLVPRATLRSWVAGMSYGSGSERKLFKAVIQPAAKSPVALSFINLIEAHVLAAIRRKHRVDMPAVRRAIEYLKKNSVPRIRWPTTNLKPTASIYSSNASAN